MLDLLMSAPNTCDDQVHLALSLVEWISYLLTKLVALILGLEWSGQVYSDVARAMAENCSR